MTDSLFVLMVLVLLVAASEWLVQRTFLKHLGTALLVILLTAVVANLGLIPAGSTAENPVPVYDGIFSYIAPLAIFWLLLPVNLRDVLKAGGPMLALFGFGVIGTTVGVLLGLIVIGGVESLGAQGAALAGMFTGTYIGGSVNFNAIALEYDIVREGGLYAGTVVVDNIVTTLWMTASLGLPRLLAPLWRTKDDTAPADTAPREVLSGIEEDTESIHPFDFGLVLGLGFGAVWLSRLLAGWLAPVPSVLILTVLALVLAQIPAVARLRGVRVLGLFAVYLFLAVIGAFCDVAALLDVGQLGVVLLVLAVIAVFTNGLFIFSAARFFRWSPDLASVASQANVGGPGSALAVARSLGRGDLVLPGVLIGTLGYAVGTFVGFLVVGWVG